MLHKDLNYVILLHKQSFELCDILLHMQSFELCDILLHKQSFDEFSGKHTYSSGDQHH